MTLDLPVWLRRTLYALTILGAPVAVYLRAKDIIGDLELTFWGAEVAAVNTLALLKTGAVDQVAVTGPAEVTPLAETPPEGGW
jgi:hypothetical protein